VLLLTVWPVECELLADEPFDQELPSEVDWDCPELWLCPTLCDSPLVNPLESVTPREEVFPLFLVMLPPADSV